MKTETLSAAAVTTADSVGVFAADGCQIPIIINMNAHAIAANTRKTLRLYLVFFISFPLLSCYAVVINVISPLEYIVVA